MTVRLNEETGLYELSGEAHKALTEWVPGHISGALERWVLEGIHPGGFLEAVCRGKLFEAVNRADAYNVHKLQSITRWLWHYAPSGCIRKGFDDWKGFNAERRREMAKAEPQPMNPTYEDDDVFSAFKN